MSSSNNRQSSRRHASRSNGSGHRSSNAEQSGSSRRTRHHHTHRGAPSSDVDCTGQVQPVAEHDDTSRWHEGHAPSYPNVNHTGQVQSAAELDNTGRPGEGYVPSHPPSDDDDDIFPVHPVTDQNDAEKNLPPSHSGNALDEIPSYLRYCHGQRLSFSPGIESWGHNNTPRASDIPNRGSEYHFSPSVAPQRSVSPESVAASD